MSTADPFSLLVLGQDQTGEIGNAASAEGSWRGVSNSFEAAAESGDAGEESGDAGEESGDAGSSSVALAQVRMTPESCHGSYVCFSSTF
jgi:hypothetical protein